MSATVACPFCGGTDEEGVLVAIGQSDTIECYAEGCDWRGTEDELVLIEEDA